MRILDNLDAGKAFDKCEILHIAKSCNSDAVVSLARFEPLLFPLDQSPKNKYLSSCQLQAKIRRHAVSQNPKIRLVEHDPKGR